MVIAKNQDTNTPEELQIFGRPDYKTGIINRVEDDYAQVDITSDDKERAEYFDSNLVVLAGMWAGDTVVIENRAEFNPGIIQVTLNVTGNIKSRQEREADNERKAQEAQEIIAGLDMDAIRRAFPPFQENEE